MSKWLSSTMFIHVLIVIILVELLPEDSIGSDWMTSFRKDFIPESIWLFISKCLTNNLAAKSSSFYLHVLLERVYCKDVFMIASGDTLKVNLVLLL